MRWGRLGSSVCVAAVVGSLVAGCGTSTRMLVEPSTDALSDKRRGVAVVQFSMPNENCLLKVLAIGTREGNGHRLVKQLFAKGAAPATTANAAEVELESGEYQVLGFLCKRQRSTIGAGTDGGPYTPSIGRFTVAPGEVVNIGHITFKKVWGSNEMKVDVADCQCDQVSRHRLRHRKDPGARRVAFFVHLRTHDGP